MGKYGRKAEISLNPLDYSLCLIGPSGIGKTTIIKEYCEKLVGDNYLFLTCGKESDIPTINGIIWEPVWTWDKYEEVVNDIIKNRFTDYKDLKAIVIDTIDELMNMAEGEVVTLWNRENRGDLSKQVKSFKATYGGFNGPTNKAIEIALDPLWQLKRIGVSPIIIGHTKKTENTDAITLQSYSTISTNMDRRYFNAINTKIEFGGVAYIDRSVERVKTGKKNPVNKKDEIIGRVKEEKRMICFRDDDYVIDAKCRFPQIVDKIPLDSDELIKAITDAIKAEYTRYGASYEEGLKKQALNQKADEEIQAERANEYTKENEKNAIAELEEDRELWIDTIKNNYVDASPEVKAKIKEIKNNVGLVFTDPDFPIKELKKVYDLLA